MQALAISAAPCGYCRQFLYELVTAQQLNILLPNNPSNPLSYTSSLLTLFLPDPFGPGDLGVTGGLMDPELCTHVLQLTSPSNDPVVQTALQAASGSYAPAKYFVNKSTAYAGVAVELSDGSVYGGRHGENAAYKPSLSPLESALAYMNMQRPQTASRTVTRCVLVEVLSLISQLSATQAVIAAYAPDVNVDHYTASVVS